MAANPRAHAEMLENFALVCSDSDGIRQLRLVIEELRAGATDLLRPGVTTDDLELLLVSLGPTVQLTDEHDPRMWHRLLRISLDDLRAGHDERPQPRTGPPNPEAGPETPIEHAFKPRSEFLTPGTRHDR